MGVYPITKTYGAQHGYSVNIFPARGILELRASYFSSHTYNKVSTWDCLLVYIRTDLLCHVLFQKDEVFGFNFNLIVSHGGQWKTHPLSKNCTPALSWAPKEITCEVNYMEVTMGLPVIGSMYFSLGLTLFSSVGVAKTWGHLSIWDATSRREWLQTGIFSTVCTADVTMLWIILMLHFQNYPLVTEDLHMVLHTYGAKLKPMSLSDAFRQGYVFHVTYERLVLRTAYGQVDSVATEVNVH